MEFDELSRKVIGCAIEVHRNLGPGLLESTYRQCLACELSHAGIAFQMELPLPVRYKELLLDCGYRIDLLVAGELIDQKRRNSSSDPRGPDSHLHETGKDFDRTTDELQRHQIANWHPAFRLVTFFAFFVPFVVKTLL
jgi:hypothetical protein